MFWPYKFCTDDKKLLSFAIRVFSKSWWSAKFAGYIMWTSCLLFFRNYPSLNRVFMCCCWLKKPKFNNVCVLSKHSNFAPECWKCILRGPGFKIFPSLPTPKLLPPTENLIEKPCATACIFVCRRTQNFTTIDQENIWNPMTTRLIRPNLFLVLNFRPFPPRFFPSSEERGKKYVFAVNP